MHSDFNRFINPLYNAINYGKLLGIFMLFFLTMFMMFNEFVASVYRSAETHINGSADIHGLLTILLLSEILLMLGFMLKKDGAFSFSLITLIVVTAMMRSLLDVKHIEPFMMLSIAGTVLILAGALALVKLARFKWKTEDTDNKDVAQT